MFDHSLNIYLSGFDQYTCTLLRDLSPHNINILSTPEFNEKNLPSADFVIANPDESNINAFIDEIISHHKIDMSNLILCLDRTEFDLLKEEYLNQLCYIWPKNPTDREIKYFYTILLRYIRIKRSSFEYKEVLKTFINSTDDLIWVKDVRGSHRLFNDSFLNALPRASDGHKKNFEECLNRGHLFLWELSPEDYEEGEYICMESEDEVIAANKILTFDEILKVSSGELRNLVTKKAPLHDEDGNIIGTIGIARDVTQELQYKAQLEKSAYTDDLTGLYNRRYIYDVMHGFTNKKITVFFMDLNNFKSINDKFGHAQGDAALVLTAETLVKVLPDYTVGRTGGDEFIAIGDIVENPKEIALSIEDALNNAYKKDPGFLGLSVSVGFASLCDENQSLDDLVGEADVRMYRRKLAIKN